MEKFIFISIILISIIDVINANFPDAGLTTHQLIEYWGYPAETHETLTNDGYFLILHRIPHGKSTPTDNNNERPVFFLQHGLLGSSASWLLNLPHQSLGFILADAGFDVWMGNTRGNTYSRKHRSLNITNNAFWEFSFDDMAKYDLPAMIDYVLNTTRKKQVYYVGYSQGNIIAFAGLSESEDLRTKIKINFALGPVTRIRHINYLLKKIAEFEMKITKLFKSFEIVEFLPSSKSLQEISEVLCTKTPLLCDILFFLLGGYDMKNLNETRIPLYVTYIPAGTSSKNFLHYLQMINSKLFRKYDYKLEGNLEHYSSIVPPPYDIENVDTPTVLMYGTEDALATPEDVEWTGQQLPNVIAQIEIKDYNHLDFIWALSAAKEVHEKIIDITLNVEL